MFRIFVVALALLTFGCGTIYYTRAFRHESVTPQKYYYSTPKEVIDGKIGRMFGSDWLIRAVALYETNNQARLSRSEYSFTLQQVARLRLDLKPDVDSLIISFLPTGIDTVLRLRRSSIDTISFGGEHRRILSFGGIQIPAGIDTITVLYTARDREGTTEHVQFRMIRFEARHEKFGLYPKD